MCGIVGIMSFQRESDVIHEGILASMTRSISHRGPDDSGCYIDPSNAIGLGFRRLSIIDLSPAGHQPMATHDGKVHIVFNGEIYNHSDLRKDLIKKGYNYHSATDTESILYCYQEYGPDFVKYLRGMFAIGIWDSDKRTLMLVRDRIGVKPLYYYANRDFLAFASEIKALLEHPRIKAELNYQGMSDYLTVMTTPTGETMFKGIRKLEAGNFIIATDDGKLVTRRYWSADPSLADGDAPPIVDEQTTIHEIRSYLRESVRLRMMSDVPFGVLLSGGIDSSLNVALMSELMSRPVDTFSVGYDLEKYDELSYARAVASKFNTNHKEIILRESDLISFLPRMIWHLDEPNADPVCFPMYYASKLARDSGTTVVQVGEGSDEQFAGYNHYLRELRYYSYYHKRAPLLVKKAAYGLLRAAAPFSLLTEYARRSSKRLPAFNGGALVFSEEMKTHLLNSEFRTNHQSSSRLFSEYDRLYKAIAGSKLDGFYLQRLIFTEFRLRLPELLLMRVDKMSMATSIEARVPFLDHKLVEYTYNLPDSFRINKGVTKYILKKAAEGIIPHDIIYRKKKGFAAPVVEWLRTGELSTLASSTILDSPLFNGSVFNRPFVEKLIKDHKEGTRNNGGAIWSLFVLALWHDRFLLKK